LKRGKSIYHPYFCGNGTKIVASGDKSKKLSLYCTKTGDTVSRGSLPFNVSYLSLLEPACSTLILADGKELHIYEPQLLKN
jgi:hypothetical protein